MRQAVSGGHDNFPKSSWQVEEEGCHSSPGEAQSFGHASLCINVEQLAERLHSSGGCISFWVVYLYLKLHHVDQLHLTAASHACKLSMYIYAGNLQRPN
jgi:hypothetical protein